MDEFALVLEVLKQMNIPMESSTIESVENKISDVAVKDIFKLKEYGTFLHETGLSLDISINS